MWNHSFFQNLETGAMRPGFLRKPAASGIMKGDDITEAIIIGIDPQTQEILADIAVPLAVPPTPKSVAQAKTQ